VVKGNGTLLLKIVYHDFRKRIYDGLGKLVDTLAGALAFMDRYIDRTEGRPGRKVQQPTAHRSTFILTTRDGHQVEMLPEAEERTKPAATQGPVTGDDAMILAPELARMATLMRV
jgi:hypothetical protein